jgi:hypothetical protein
MLSAQVEQAARIQEQQEVTAVRPHLQERLRRLVGSVLLKMA